MTNDLADALRLSATAAPVCRPCRQHLLALRHAHGDLADGARKAARAREEHREQWTAEVAERKRQLAWAVSAAEEHLSEPHAPKDAPPVAPAQEPKADDGRVACPKCGEARPRPRGNRVRRHQTRNDITCPGGWLVKPTFDLTQTPLSAAATGDAETTREGVVSAQGGGRVRSRPPLKP